MNAVQITLPSGAPGYASMDDVGAAIEHLLAAPVAAADTPAGRDEGARVALNEDYFRAILQAVVDRAAARGIVAR